ncbi:hypothetical protein RJ640_017713 [Escallonia rubra]|uniref:Retrotransposon Copia-like N-terminal domain-containing protein n=1 Tax=Escallonia rubra TaxID=112253 RepID=A0AA88R7G2_9ASTE|nr:hypothetical protein RJ640_017713 [Escallonia rubra]
MLEGEVVEQSTDDCSDSIATREAKIEISMETLSSRRTIEARGWLGRRWIYVAQVFMVPSSVCLKSKKAVPISSDLATMSEEHDDQVGMGNIVAGYGKAIEVNSPYYLHPSDHPGLVFVTPPLTENGENYFTWRRNMMTTLELKNKVGFIDNSVTKPKVKSQDFQPWWLAMGNIVAGYGKAIEVNSPYYLHPSDHPGLVFVTPPLTENGENYFTWRRNMMTTLELKNKVGFIDNSVTKPKVKSQDFQPWVKCNGIVLSWLTNYLAK